jgi:hypothetical protein
LYSTLATTEYDCSELWKETPVAFEHNNEKIKLTTLVLVVFDVVLFDVVVVLRVVVVEVTAPGIHWLRQYVRSRSQHGEDSKLLPVVIVLLDTVTAILTTSSAGISDTAALLPIQPVSNRDRRID